MGGFPELVLRNSSVIRFRPGPWNGIRFSGTHELKPNKFFTVSVVINEKEVYDTYVLHDSLVLLRMVLTHDGLWERQTWTDGTQSWLVFVTVQMDPCDSYAQCCSYRSCNATDLKCGCLKGFVPKSQNVRDTDNRSHGCVRITLLKCKSDRFLKYSNVKLPNSRQSWFNYSMNLDECKNLCARNCFCTAYSNLDIRNGGSGCMLWFVDLIDIQQFSANGQDLYVRLAASELDHGRKFHVESNVTGQSSKPVTMTQDAPRGGVKVDLGEFRRADHLRPQRLRDERSSPVTSGIQAIGLKALLGC
ncbi:hypothetical protein PVK06_048836 [Gossypium arboreum]|uniref:Apple domain-containing protein n=1 Tax=Gossypium arboreum TaxID=29729 RepID=A0ABR0MIZ4_GOSAR|nr:hypothetical protein PVK06_048836 [Gossypium arboreum]